MAIGLLEGIMAGGKSMPPSESDVGRKFGFPSQTFQGARPPESFRSGYHSLPVAARLPDSGAKHQIGDRLLLGGGRPHGDGWRASV